MDIDQYKNYTDADLLELISMYQDEDFKPEAECAFQMLYNRYWKVSYYIALKICSYQKDPEEDAQDLVQATFIKVFQNAGTYNKDKASKASQEAYAVPNWITGIMKRVFFDLYLQDSSIQNAPPNQPGSEYILAVNSLNSYLNEIEEEVDIPSIEFSGRENQRQEQAEGNEDNTSSNLDAVHKFIEGLSERDADILRECYQYYIPGKKMPREVLNSLEVKHNTTKDNIRQILKRTRDSCRKKLIGVIRMRP